MLETFFLTLLLCLCPFGCPSSPPWNFTLEGRIFTRLWQNHAGDGAIQDRNRMAGFGVVQPDSSEVEQCLYVPEPHLWVGKLDHGRGYGWRKGQPGQGCWTPGLLTITSRKHFPSHQGHMWKLAIKRQTQTTGCNQFIKLPLLWTQYCTVLYIL